MTHAVALRYQDKWIDFEFIPADNPLEVAMRHVLPEYRDAIKPVLLASYTQEEFDALMGSPLYAAMTVVMNDREAMRNIGSGIGFDDFVRVYYPGK